MAYRLIVGCVTPRPVAWITTVSADGRVNAAPFSSYNYVATSPFAQDGAAASWPDHVVHRSIPVS